MAGGYSGPPAREAETSVVGSEEHRSELFSARFLQQIHEISEAIVYPLDHGRVDRFHFRQPRVQIALDKPRVRHDRRMRGELREVQEERLAVRDSLAPSCNGLERQGLCQKDLLLEALFDVPGSPRLCGTVARPSGIFRADVAS